MKIGMLALFFLFSALQTLQAHAETSPADLQKKMEESIAFEQNAQKQAEAWASERANILNEIREQNMLKKWAKHQAEKYQTYIQKQQDAIRELERRKQEAEKIKMSLEPFLDEIFVRLKTLIEKDLPFLPEERQKRLEFLKDSLDDYRIGLDEKTKRVLEVLQIEANYSGTVEKTEAAVDLGKGPVQVSLFRLGRVALFYQSPDRRQTGWYNREKNKWESLPDEYTRELTRAMEIAEKKRTPVLLELPVGRAAQ